MISINITCSLYSNSVCLQVCEEPHPLLIKEMISHCEKANIDDVYKILKSLWDKGYAAVDIIGNIFRVCTTPQIGVYQGEQYLEKKV